MQINLFDALFSAPVLEPDPTPNLLQPVAYTHVEPNDPKPVSRSDFGYSIQHRDQIVLGGEVTRIDMNLKAIEILFACQAEQRQPRPDETQTLARWCSWGPVARLFNQPTPPELVDRFDRLSTLLSASAVEGLLEDSRATILNAFFTDPEIARAIWSGIASWGLEGVRNIVEPAAGSGVFLGTMPDILRCSSNVHAVEIDPTTAGICQLLYPGAVVRKRPFQDVNLEENSVDLFISNVPFASYSPVDENDSELRVLSPVLHDYFFAKAVKCLRPGGLLAFVTSIGTLDKKLTSVREWLARRADLVGALRLPDNTFAGNANTKVVTDIVILQKRSTLLEGDLPKWVYSQPMDPEDKEDDAPWINRYYTENRQDVLGRIEIKDWRNSQKEVLRRDLVVKPDRENLHEWIANAMSLWASAGRLNLQKWRSEPSRISLPTKEDVIPWTSTLPIWSLVDHEGAIWVFNGKELQPFPEKVSSTRLRCLQDALQIRDILMEILRAQRTNPDEAETLRARLNEVYDRFTQRHGHLNTCKAIQLLRKDYGTGHYLLALEIINPSDKSVSKADIFHKPTQKPYSEPEKADSAEDALSICLSARGKIDLRFMEELTGKPEEELIHALGESIFLDPAISEWVPAALYLSGAVRTKLQVAKLAKEVDARFERNVIALESALPEDFGPDRITLNFGATWIPAKAYEQFLRETIHGGWRLTYSPSASTWIVTASDRQDPTWNIVSQLAPKPAVWLVDRMLQGGAIVVETTERLEGKKVVLQDETAQANYKADLLRERFATWLWGHDVWAEKVIRNYNDQFNNYVPAVYEGSHLLHPSKSSNGTPRMILRGQNPEVQMAPHQVNFIWRGINNPTSLAHHDVGAGKSYALIALIMECRRLGLLRKPILTSPGYVFNQLAQMWRYLYPDAKLLVIDPKDLTKERRPIMMSRIATGDWDGILMAHSSFTKIPMSPEYQKAYFEGKIRELEMELASDDDKRSSKRIEEAKERLKSRLKRLEARWNKDRGPYYDDLGIDGLFVDESHSHKNLFLYSRMRESGVNTSQDVQRAYDMEQKCRFTRLLPAGKVVFATGTPVSNSMTELYVVMQYLQAEHLDQIGLGSFDAWARTYGQVVPDIETTVDGSGVRVKSRFRKFINIPSLQQLWQRISDRVKISDTAIEVPEIAGGRPERIMVERTEFQVDYIEDLKARIDAIAEGKVRPEDDNMLKVVTDGRKLALDQRLINPTFTSGPDSKIGKMARKVLEVYRDTEEHLGTQVIWCDLGTPSKKRKLQVEQQPEVEEIDSDSIEASTGEPDIDMDVVDEFEEFTEGVNLYEDIRDRLVELGIPREEVAFIHEAKTPEQRLALYAAMNSGKIRVLVASTGKLSMGANIQTRLAAMHHLHPTWKPSDMDQRNGRGIRQGNIFRQLGGIKIFFYILTASFDAYYFQLNEMKASFLDQFFSGKGTATELDNIDFASDAYAELKAAAAADPRIGEMVKLQYDIKQMEVRKRARSNEIYTLKCKIKNNLGWIEHKENSIAMAREEYQRLSNPSLEDLEIFGKTYPTLKEAGTALWLGILDKPKAVVFGRYRHLELTISLEGWKDGSRVISSNMNNLGVRRTASVGAIPLAQAVMDYVTRSESDLDWDLQGLERYRRENEELQAQLVRTGEFEDQEILDNMIIRLSELQRLLQVNSKSTRTISIGWSYAELTDLKQLLPLFGKSIYRNEYGTLAKLVEENRRLPGTESEILTSLHELLKVFLHDAEKLALNGARFTDSKGHRLHLLAMAFNEAIQEKRLTSREILVYCTGLTFLERAAVLLQVREFSSLEEPARIGIPHINGRITTNWKALVDRHFPQYSPKIAPFALINRLQQLGVNYSKMLDADGIRRMHATLVRSQASTLSVAA
jgi:N12 class adenine-specific DNA methylase